MANFDKQGWYSTKPPLLEKVKSSFRKMFENVQRNSKTELSKLKLYTYNNKPKNKNWVGNRKKESAAEAFRKRRMFYENLEKEKQTDSNSDKTTKYEKEELYNTVKKTNDFDWSISYGTSYTILEEDWSDVDKLIEAITYIKNESIPRTKNLYRTSTHWSAAEGFSDRMLYHIGNDLPAFEARLAELIEMKEKHDHIA